MSDTLPATPPDLPCALVEALGHLRDVVGSFEELGATRAAADTPLGKLHRDRVRTAARDVLSLLTDRGRRGSWCEEVHRHAAAVLAVVDPAGSAESPTAASGATGLKKRLEQLLAKARDPFDPTQDEGNHVAAELALVQRSRRGRPVKQPGTTSVVLPDPTTFTTRNDLVGLAFSGGGVRSATFNLGVVQALISHRVFPHVDYISTVSGGSYMGAFLASLATRRSPTELVESLEHVPGRAEESGGELRHLRKHASYLSPDGSPLFVAGVSVLLLRGILTNLLLLLPFVVWVSQVAALTHGDWIQTAGMNGWSGWFEAYPLTIIGSAIMLAALLVNMIMERWSRRPPGAKGLAAWRGMPR